MKLGLMGRVHLTPMQATDFKALFTQLILFLPHDLFVMIFMLLQRCEVDRSISHPLLSFLCLGSSLLLLLAFEAPLEFLMEFLLRHDPGELFFFFLELQLSKFTLFFHFLESLLNGLLFLLISFCHLLPLQFNQLRLL